MSRDTSVLFLLTLAVAAGTACSGADLPTSPAEQDTVADVQALAETQSYDITTGTGGETARSADAFVNSIGVNVHLSYLDRVYGSGFSTIIKPKLAKLGVRHLRDGGQVNSNDGWMRTIYGRMKEVAAIGPKFTLIMSPQGGNYNNADHVVRLMQYAGPAVEAFEGPNELDMRGGYWAPNMRAFQRALYNRVKSDATLRQYPVLGPSLGRAGRAADAGDLQAAMDIASVHLYAGGGIPTTSMSYTLTQTAAMNGTKPVWITESGYHNATSSTDPHAAVSERAAGRYVPRMFLDYFNAGIERTFAYELIDQGTDRSDLERNFGLLRVDGAEKPAYRALTNLIGLLADPGSTPTLGKLSYTVKGDTENLRRTLLQKRDGTFYLILWIDASSYDTSRRADITVPVRTLTLELGTTISRAQVFDPLVGTTASSTVNAPRAMTVKVSDAPIVVELKR